MNFVGKFDAHPHLGGSGAHPDTNPHVSSHAPSDAIIVPDADLLFKGDFKRSGVDLVLSKDDHELVLQDYFKGEKRAALASPDGAHLTGDLVNALTGHVEYAQADGSASVGKVIGHVTKLAGTATAIRNGVSIILNMGDNVEKGDLVQSGSSSTLGVTFIDGTVFGLASNARMVLNEMVYDPNGSNNSSLISLVAGTISFVAGQTAKHGDMKIDTPVATMGIRGTAVLVEIDFDIPGQNGTPEAKFQVLTEPDGTTGSYLLFEKGTLTQLALVNVAGQQVSVSNNNVNYGTGQLSPEIQQLITDVFAQRFTDTNPKSLNQFTDTLTPQTLAPIKLADGASATPVVFVTSASQTTSTGQSGFNNGIIPRISPTVVAVGGTLTALPDTVSHSAIDTASGQIRFVDINPTDLPTVATEFVSFTYQNAQHQDVTATLNAQQLADINALEAPLVVVPAPGNNNNGTASWTYTIPNQAAEFLGAGETLTLTYIAQVNSNHPGANLASSQSFTVTIAGVNDFPSIATTSVHFSSGKAAFDHASGTIAFTDVNLTDRPVVSAAFTSFTLTDASHHALTLTAQQQTEIAAVEVPVTIMQAGDTNSGAATWTYSVADSNFDFLATGDILTLTYTATVNDGHGGVVTQPIAVTVTGAPDIPAIVGETNPSTQTISLVTTPIVLDPGVNENSLGLPTETFDSHARGSASNNGFGYGNFFSFALGATFTASGDAGVINGSSAVTTAPFVGPLPGEPDTANYLSVGANAAETIRFASEQDVFGLYWGSADSFNTINFYNGAELVASYTGADLSPLLPNGDHESFSSNGYVEFSDLAPFNKVVLSSAANAFEIENISAGFVSQLRSPISGTLTVSDAVIGDALTGSVIGNGVVTYDGSTTLPVDASVTALIDAAAITFDSVKTDGGLDILHWTYNPTNVDLDFLQPGHTLTITFEAQVSNGHFNTGDLPLTITLVGAAALVMPVAEETHTIGAGASFQISSSSADTVLFSAINGTLVLDSPSHFTGEIAGISGSGDILDLKGLDTSTIATTGSGSYDAVTGTTTLTVTDSSQDLSIPITLVGDYSNSTWTVTDDGHGGVDIVDPPAAHAPTTASGASLQIASGASLEIANPVTAGESVAFQSSTGSLTLDVPSNFDGVISGFTGDGTLAGSDKIDLKGIDYHSSRFSESFNAATDTLSVSDGTDHTALQFNGTYQAANFKFASDGNAGTIVYDPPVYDSPGGELGAGQARSGGGDSFVFKFAHDAHDGVPDVHPAHDAHQYTGPSLGIAQVAWSELHDASYGGMIPNLEGHEAIASAEIFKAQQQASDFPFI